MDVSVDVTIGWVTMVESSSLTDDDEWSSSITEVGRFDGVDTWVVKDKIVGRECDIVDVKFGVWNLISEPDPDPD